MAIKKKARPKKTESIRTIVSFDPMSVARVSLGICGGAGVVMAFFFALVQVGAGVKGEAWASVVLIPFAYGFGGAFFAAISAWLYNQVAGRIGGIKVQVR